MAKYWMSVLLFSVLLPTAAWAQDEPSEFGEDSELGSDPEAGDTDNVEGAEVLDEEPATEVARDPNADQWLVGVQWRQLIIPSFVQQVFLDEAPTVFEPTFQVVATKRNSENFSLVFGLGYASYAADGLYRAKGDPVEDTEWMKSDLGLIHGTFSALWGSNINEYLDFEYGLGGELGIVTGELRRSEASKVTGTWQPCSGVGNPDIFYCAPTSNGRASDAHNKDGEHYNVVEERIPPIFLLPTLFQVGLRITPTPQVAIKLEGAYATAAFWFGASLHLNVSQL